MEIEDLKKDKENVKNKQQNKLKIVLVIIGVVLFFSALRSVYYTYREDKSYELKGWQTATATCTQENSYTRTTTRE